MALIVKIEKILSDLKGKNEEINKSLAKKMKDTIETEFKNCPSDVQIKVMNILTEKVLECMKSNEIVERKTGLILASSLVDLEVNDFGFKSQILKVLTTFSPSSDIDEMKLNASILLRLLQQGIMTSEVFEREIKKASIYLADDQNERKLYSLILIIECCKSIPNQFYPYLTNNNLFFRVCSNLSSSKIIVRDVTLAVIRSCLDIFVAREGCDSSIRNHYTSLFKNSSIYFKYETKNMSEDNLLASLKGLELLLSICTFKSQCFIQEATILYTNFVDINELNFSEYSNSSARPRFTIDYYYTEDLKHISGSVVPLNSTVAAKLIFNHYYEIMKYLFQYINHKNQNIINLCVFLIALMGEVNPKEFTKLHLRMFCNFLHNNFSIIGDINNLFLSLAIVCYQQQYNILTEIDSILTIVSRIIPQKEKKQKEFFVEPIAMACITILAKILEGKPEGLIIYQHFTCILDYCSLSPAIVTSLINCFRSIPNSKNIIRNFMGIILFRILKINQIETNSLQTCKHYNLGIDNVNQTILAIRTLRCFEMPDIQSFECLYKASRMYLVSSNPAIRLEAVKSCCKIIISMSRITQNDAVIDEKQLLTIEKNIFLLLKHLIIVGVSDNEESVRKFVVHSLYKSSIPQLGHYEIVKLLCLNLKDSNIDIKECSIGILGKLFFTNPSIIKPILDKILIESLIELRSDLPIVKAINAIRILTSLVRSSESIAKTTMNFAINYFINHITNNDNLEHSRIIITLISDLSFQCGFIMNQFISNVLDKICSLFLKKSSINLRECIVECLVLILRNTGYFVEENENYLTILNIIFNLIKVEQIKSTKRLLFHAVGYFGARETDNTNLKALKSSKTTKKTSDIDSYSLSWRKHFKDLNICEILQKHIVSDNLDEFYSGLCIDIMLNVLLDKSLNNYHSMAIQAVQDICIEIRGKSLQFIPQIFSVYIKAIRNYDVDMKVILLQQMSRLLVMAKIKTEEYIDDIFSIIAEIWLDSVPFNLELTIVKVVESVQASILGKVSAKISLIISRMMKILIIELPNPSEDNQLTSQLLSAIQRMSLHLKDYMFMIVPSIIFCFTESNKSQNIKILAMDTLIKILSSNDIKEYISLIITSVFKAMNQNQIMQESSIHILCALLEHEPVNMKNFLFAIKQSMIRSHINNLTLNSCIQLVENSSIIVLEKESYSNRSVAINNLLQQRNKDRMDSGASIYRTNFDNIMKALKNTQIVDKDGWSDWLSRLSIEFIKESPSPIIRKCHTISKSCAFARDSLFNFAFFSIWRESKYENKIKISDAINQVMLHLDKNDSIMVFLNLAELLERSPCDHLTIEPENLAMFALKSSSFIKALRYNELSFTSTRNIDVLQSLISMNINLDNQDDGEGVLAVAMRQDLVDIKLQQQFYENLHDWAGALKNYDEKLTINPEDSQYLLGKMRCLEALCEWKELDRIVDRDIKKYYGSDRIEVARMGSYCSLGLGKWDALKRYMCYIPQQKFEGSFFRAVYNIQNNSLLDGKKYLNIARNIIGDEVPSLLTDSYDKGYNFILNCQILTEIEEVIDFKIFPTLRDKIKRIWDSRIKHCKKVVGDWQRILDIRSLVLHPTENIDTFLRFISICLKSNRYSLCSNAFSKLLDSEKINQFENGILPDVENRISLSYIKYMWASAKHLQAISLLNIFTKKNVSVIESLTHDNGNRIQDISLSLRKPLAKGFLQLSQWENAENINDLNLKSITSNYLNSIKYYPEWYKAWYSWAKFNYEIVLNYKHTSEVPSVISSQISSSVSTNYQTESADKLTKQAMMTQFVLPGIRAFFKSITISETNCLQNILRLLTLWFEFGESSLIDETMQNEISSIKTLNWLQVVPQLIARIDDSKPRVRNSIQQLLIKLSSSHPQAVIYSLMVSEKSVNSIRSSTVKSIIKSIADRDPALVEQALMISQELIRVSILWSEEWCAAIEEASKVCFNDKNIEKALSILDAIHNKVIEGPKTPYEISFIQAYGRDINQALLYRNNYSKDNDTKDLMQAWKIYYRIFKKLSKKMSYIDLVHVSPELMACANTTLAIPGTYQPNSPPVYIHSVNRILKIIGSKQKPRKLSFRGKCVTESGSDGNIYEFLLKSHEDLRQDERVMQLFGLLNNILANNYETSKRNLVIKRYSVTPISTDSGLIEWVPECDTLYSLIKDHRQRNNIPLQAEFKYEEHYISLINKYCPCYNKVDALRMFELFEMAIEQTSDDDLACSMWQKSTNAECWYDRKVNFIRSLAVMSMVGYVLGLGDRHLSNIMVERKTGTIIHIDFGDCFEVSMKREKFPERVPFRLTRMLIKCMGINGIEGSFKITCMRVMEVLRENKDSLLAVLEAFIYDPLLSFKLIESTPFVINSKKYK